MSDCWTTRSEGDPRYDNHADTWNPPFCNHAECVASPDAAIDCIVSRMDALCVLEKGHQEPHDFDSDTVLIEFPALIEGGHDH